MCELKNRDDLIAAYELDRNNYRRMYGDYPDQATILQVNGVTLQEMIRFCEVSTSSSDDPPTFKGHELMANHRIPVGKIYHSPAVRLAGKIRFCYGDKRPERLNPRFAKGYVTHVDQWTNWFCLKSMLYNHHFELVGYRSTDGMTQWYEYHWDRSELRRQVVAKLPGQ